MYFFFIFFFFFQAEDGIRDLTVTGVQTCALPISFNLDYSLTHTFPLRRSLRLQLGLVGYGQWQTSDKHGPNIRSEEHTSELQSQSNLVCRLLLEKKKQTQCHQLRSTSASPTHSMT